jgi:hypothetical protein
MIHCGNAGRTDERDVRPRLGAERFCCLHLGMRKTASTCIQRNLFAKHSQIAYLGKYDGQDNLYPSRAARTLHAHLVGRRAPSIPRCRALVSRFVSRAVDAGRVPVFSREGLTAGGSSHKRKQARLFRELVGDCKAMIVVRRPLDFVESMYFQDLKGFQKLNRKLGPWAARLGEAPRYFSIEQWLGAMWSLPKKGAFGHLLCAETADAYADVFGRDRVRVFLFEQLVQDTDGVIADLCEFIGIDAEEGVGLLQGRRANDRWTELQIRRLKQIERSPMRRTLYRRGPKVVRDRLLALDGKAEPGAQRKAQAAIPAAWQERIVQYARDDHRRLAQHWGLPLDQYGYSL